MSERTRKIPRARGGSFARQTISADTWERFGLPWPFEEMVVVKGRKWRADFLWRTWKSGITASQPAALVVEVNGGVWRGGRHSGGIGQIRDMEKLNHLALHGYAVMQFTPKQVLSGYAPALVQAWLEGKAAPDLPPDPEQQKKPKRRARR